MKAETRRDELVTLRTVLLLLCLSVSGIAFGGHPDHALGLRWAGQVSPERIRLLFGSSFVESVGRNPQTYRVVSPTDPDFQMGVRAQSVSVTAEDDGPFPEGWRGRSFQKFHVTVDLPRPMKPDHRYWVQAMGVNHQPVTGGRAAAWIAPDPTPPVQATARNGLGLRRVEIIDSHTVLLTLGAGVHTPPTQAEPPARKAVYSADFENGVPKSWQAYQEVTEGLPAGNGRAVQAAHLIQWNGSMMVQDYQQAGVFSANAESGTISFDYFAENASALQVRLTTDSGTLVYTQEKPAPGRWSTLSLRLSDFQTEGQPDRKAQGPLRVQCLQFIVLKAQAAPSLRIDNIQVLSGPPILAGSIPPHDPNRYVLRSAEDPDFTQGRPAIRMGRRSRIDGFYPDGWPYGTFLKHEVFLQLDRPLQEGQTYTINLNEGPEPISCGQARGTLVLSSQTSINPCIKVNQLGYLPSAPARFAYVGCWMGSLGALALSPLESARFEVRDARTHAAVLQGTPRLRLKHALALSPDGTPEPAGAKGKETVYGQDLSYEDIYELDLTPLVQEGEYYVAIPGMGRSLSFAVRSNIYEEAFRITMRGLFHQRCGLAMTAPLTNHFRPACHRNRTELTDLVPGRNNWAELPKHVTDETKYDLYGGHHDAGDYNPRSHLDVVEFLFLAYELTPSRFRDGQANIPENGNGIPDILDEARWGLDLWLRLQDPEDGGVRHGIESDGDPDMITTPELDDKRDFAFAKDAPASLRFAGAAAQASIIWNRLGRKDDAADLLRRARAAYGYAMENMGSSFPDDLVFGAIQLYRATGEERFLKDFHTHTVFAREDRPELEVWQKYDQQLASFYYALCERPVLPAIRSKILDAYRRRMATWIQWAESTGYRAMRSPYAPSTWGTGAYPIWADTPMQAYALLKEPDYLKWIILTCDFSLGCHPMGTVFTVGLGQRYITGPLHTYGRYSPDGPIEGTQCEGPSPQVGGSPAGKSMSSWIGAGLYPFGPWPQLHTYTDAEMSPGMNEGMVRNMVKTAIAYGFLLPEPKSPSP